MAEVAKENFYSQRNKRKPLTQFLEYVIHTKECQKTKFVDSYLESFYCESYICKYVDYVVSHRSIMNCQRKACNINSCYSSSKLFLHCKECTKSDCCICYLIKGKQNNSIESTKQVSKGLKTDEEFLDDMCGVHFEEKAISACTCENAVTVQIQTDDCDISLQNENKVCLPGGLVLEIIEFEVINGGKNPDSQVTSALRMTQIHGFIQTVIGKIDSVTVLDQKMLYFLMYVTSVEDQVYKGTNSKEEYLTMLLGKICETSKKFQEYKNQTSLSMLDYAYLYFKDRIIQMFGSEELREIIFPGVLKIRVEEPPEAKEITQRWQKTVSPSEREKEVIKLCSNNISGLFFSYDLVWRLQVFCEMEQLVFSSCDCKYCYLDYLLFKNPNVHVPSGKKKWKRDHIDADDKDRKIQVYSKKKRKIVEKLERNDSNDISMVLSNGCYSDALLFKSPVVCSPSKKNKWKRIKFNADDEDKKLHSENKKRRVEESPENKIVQEIPNDETVMEDGKNNSDDISSAPSVFCYSHNLQLTYSVAYQLWSESKKSE